jgi:7-cyano-7-deazaguanine synthase
VLSWVFAGSTLTEREGRLAGPDSVVPNRNMVLLSLATAWAITRGAGAVAYAAHASDHHVYPDCRPAFVEAMREALNRSHYTPVRLLTPFLGLMKSDVVRVGNRLGVPFGATWSCYTGGAKHCGSCGACKERRAAFRLAGVADPTVYEVSK